MMAEMLSCVMLAADCARNSFGYRQFGNRAPGTATNAEYAEAQHSGAGRVTTRYLLPLLPPKSRVLDVGCGIGAIVTALVQQNYDAYGVDVPAIAPQWAAAENDRERFLCGDATSLPFADNTFDVVTSFGVIEHVGTVNGNCTLRKDYLDHRQAYAREIIRVTRPGGKILIGCPNKAFPIDLGHGPTDALSPKHPIRSFVHAKTGMNVHPTWGTYYLVSHAELRRFFAGVASFRPISLKGYFKFGNFERYAFIRPFTSAARAWVENMPAWAAASCLNPYVMVEMIK